MRGIWNKAGGTSDGWFKDVAALISVGAFIWVVSTWTVIAQTLIG
ncbi:hypothetical protein Plav_3199 [Parvibaculum lavamentivorans DS-1]|uniref:Uncharacterized protein n=1 Tax=Parvibaculum lavamentivorans (strain DS-1 / DSM 13023 / NCIMB 13966) TaxID=402881 RepID=A7HY22_PARL1|nr:hypothetical protein [Parvibaculum lavamentivorans]ABS64805.1 hypothetical protein Plav_3199 [Parvibaculum lavamentivorans DS-1]